MQQKLSERMRCTFNTAMDMCLYGHNRMIMVYGYGHFNISSYITYIEKAAADLESKYRKKYVSSILHSITT